MTAGAGHAGTRLTVTLALCRLAAVVTLIGAGTMPPLASGAALVMLLSFLLLPDAGVRLRAVLAQPLGRGWLVFVGALLLATLWGSVLNGAATALRALYEWRHLLLIPIGLAVFDEPAARRRLALGFIAFALVGAVASGIALHLGTAFKPGQHPGVMLRNPVTQALVLAIGAYLAMVLVATRQVAAPWLRWLLGAVALALVTSLLFFQTGRSGQVAFGVMLATTALLLLRGRARVAMLALLLVTGTAAWHGSATMQKRFTMALDELRNAPVLAEYTSMGIRAVMWQTTIELIGERPLLGYGLGGLTPAYAALAEARYGAVKAEAPGGWKAIRTTDPHNQYLQLWVEAGLPGLLAFGWFLVAAARQPAPQPYRACGLALLAAWCVNSLFSSHFHVFNESLLIAVFTGVFLARDRAAAGAAARAQPTP